MKSNKDFAVECLKYFYCKWMFTSEELPTMSILPLCQFPAQQLPWAMFPPASPLALLVEIGLEVHAARPGCPQKLSSLCPFACPKKCDFWAPNKALTLCVRAGEQSLAPHPAPAGSIRSSGTQSHFQPCTLFPTLMLSLPSAAGSSSSHVPLAGGRRQMEFSLRTFLPFLLPE